MKADIDCHAELSPSGPVLKLSLKSSIRVSCRSQSGTRFIGRSEWPKQRSTLGKADAQFRPLTEFMGYGYKVVQGLASASGLYKLAVAENELRNFTGRDPLKT